MTRKYQPVSIKFGENKYYFSLHTLLKLPWKFELYQTRSALYSILPIMTQVGIIFIFFKIRMIFAFHIVKTMVHCIDMIFEVAWILKFLITLITKMSFLFCNA